MVGHIKVLSATFSSKKQNQEKYLSLVLEYNDWTHLHLQIHLIKCSC